MARVAKEREDFEWTVSFLATVPLFRKQLPRSELPRVAQSLTRRSWKPGQRLVRQGEIGRAFFLIQEGEAVVVTSSGPGEEQVRATLYPGDYFGGHTLMSERSNVATIIAKGPGPLITLSMSRSGFEDSGLKFRLRFPKRPALHDLVGDVDYKSDIQGTSSTASSVSSSSSTREDEDFVCNAIKRNGNLRAFLQVASDDELIRAVAASAEKRLVPKGEMLARRGTLCREFFIVRDGFIDAVINSCVQSATNQSAEGVLAHSAMAERLLRKETLLQQIFWHREESPSRKFHRSHSVSEQHDASPSGLRTVRSHSVQVVDSPAAAAPTTWSRWNLGTKRKRFQIEAGGPCDVPSSPSTSSRRFIGHRSKQGRRRAPSELLPGAEGGGSPKSRPRKISAIQQCRMELKGGEMGPDGKGRFVTFGSGESFGELSLMYNMKLEADFVAKEDTVVYAIPRRHLMTWFCAGSMRFREYSKFLEEVYLLSQLLSSERWELACKVQGVVEFKPGERVLSQGKPREARLWYIIVSGSAIMSRTGKTASGKEETNKLADLYRSNHFGERSLLRGEEASQVTVDAGPNGVSCLTFDGNTVLPILQEIFQPENNLCPSPRVDIEEWCRGKNEGWEQTIGWHRLTSAGKGRNWAKDGSERARHLELSKLKHVCVLGRGSYGQVILVEDSQAKQCYALKTVSKGHVKRKHAERQIRWERELLSMLASDFIIALHKTFSDEQHVYFLLEAALGGSLLEVLHLHSEVLTEDQPHGRGAAFYVGCLILALEHMHERRIVHRDVKPENVFLDAAGYAKLGDMGFARFVLGKTNTRVGTPDYMAPEMIDPPHIHDITVDWWSLGVVAFELLAGQSPWEDEGISEPIERMLTIRKSQQEGKIRFPFHFPEAARPLVKGLLQPAKSRLGSREGAAEVKHLVFFKSVGIDFRLLAARRLQAPYSPVVDEMLSIELSSSDGEELTPGPGDSIFMSYHGSSDEHWDQDF